MSSDHDEIIEGRIRRAVEPPWTSEQVKQRKRNCRHRLLVDFDDKNRMDMIYSRSRWWRMSYEDDCPIKKRTIDGWIDIGNRTVGKFEFAEFDIGPFVYDDEFRQVLDDNARIESEMADALLSCWDDLGEELGAYGTILDFRRVWMHQDYARAC